MMDKHRLGGVFLRIITMRKRIFGIIIFLFKNVFCLIYLGHAHPL